MAKKLYSLVIIIPCTSLLLLPSASAERSTLTSSEQVIEVPAQAKEQPWTQFDIDAVLNLYGPASSGPSLETTVNNLPYEEMGVYGVEYEDINIDGFTNTLAPFDAGKNNGQIEVDKIEVK